MKLTLQHHKTKGTMGNNCKINAETKPAKTFLQPEKLQKQNQIEKTTMVRLKSSDVEPSLS